MPYNHLDKKTIQLLEKTEQEKKKWIRDFHFVYYEKAKKCLNQLNWIFEQTLYSENNHLTDLESISIVGDSGTGKTSITDDFIQSKAPEHLRDHESYPVVKCTLKDSITGLKGLYSSLLSAYNHPYANPDMLRIERITIGQLEDVLIYTLKKTCTKLFFIDEFQHAIGRNQQSLLNQLKRTMLVSQVPFVPVGTLKVEDLLKIDTQLADRCPIKSYSKLEFLSYGVEFREFLAGYEKYLPFPDPSKLSSKDLSYKIFQKIQFPKPNIGKTNLRHISIFLKKVSFLALNKKHNCILEADIDATEL